MKIEVLLTLVLMIQLTFILTGFCTVPTSALRELVVNPMDWSSIDIISLFSDLFLVVGALTIAIGAFLTSKSDLAIFAGVASVFLSFGASLAEVYTQVSSQFNVGFAMLFVSPIILIYLVTVIKFWRNTA